MPLYVMTCDCCGSEKEIYRSIALIDHELPSCCAMTMRRKLCAPAVMADIAPYQAMGVDVATGKAPVITSRSEHRDYLRRNNFVEVGNEMPSLAKRKIEGDFNVRGDLAEVAKQVLPKYTV